MEFSVENRVILNARQKRQEKSKEMNPTWKNSKAAKKEKAKGKILRMIRILFFDIPKTSFIFICIVGYVTDRDHR